MNGDELISLLNQRAMNFDTDADFARDMDVSPQHVWDIFHGRRMPGKKVLDYLGLEKRVVYGPKTKEVER